MVLASLAPASSTDASLEVHDVRAFRAVTRSVGEARRWLREVLREAVLPDEQRYVLELLATELITNSVVHTPAEVITVRVGLADDGLSVSVRDPGSRRRAPAPLQDPDLGGRGLAIVARLSSCWGVRSVQGGKELWFRLDLPCAP